MYITGLSDDSIRSKFPRKPQFFTVAEVAVICNVKKQQVYEWIDAGRLRAFRLGRGRHVMRIHTRDLDQLVEDRRDEWRRDQGKSDNYQPSLYNVYLAVGSAVLY